MTRVSVLFLVLFLSWGVFGVAGTARASLNCGPAATGGEGNLANVKMALHAVAYNDVKACGGNAPAGFGCNAPSLGDDLTTTWPVGVRASVYVVALDIPTVIGLKGATFGLDFFAYNYTSYSGIYINGFNLCADLQFPSAAPDPVFPREPESGVVVTSNTCLGTVPDPTDPQGEGYAVLGWLDVTSYDHTGPLTLTPRLYLANPDFQVADCLAASSNPCYPWFAGILGFGGPGYSPCQGVPDAVEPTTWSRLKRGERGTP